MRYLPDVGNDGDAAMTAPLLSSNDRLRAFRITKLYGQFTLCLSFRSGGVIRKEFDTWESIWPYLSRFDTPAIRRADVLEPGVEV